MHRKRVPRREPFIEFDFPNFAVEQVKVLLRSPISVVRRMGSPFRRRYPPQSRLFSSVAQYRNGARHRRCLGRKKKISVFAFAAGEVLARFAGNIVGRQSMRAVGWAFAVAEWWRPQFKRGANLTHAEACRRGQSRSSCAGITYKLATDLLTDHPARNESGLANSRFMSRGGLRKETSDTRQNPISS